MDWLFPPECACCQKPNYILCPTCLEQATFIDSPICSFCGQPVSGKSTSCSECNTTLPAYNGMRSWAVYKDSIRKAIHSLKYKNNIPLGYYFSQKLYPLIESAEWDFDVVIPVPLSKSHLKERGFNQSSLIARPLSHKLGIPFDNSALMRIKETSPQFKLSAEERHINVRDAFFGNPAKINNKGVLLVDDVITTGATMNNCTKALLAAGATKVYCISVARVLIQ